MKFVQSCPGDNQAPPASPGAQGALHVPLKSRDGVGQARRISLLSPQGSCGGSMHTLRRAAPKDSGATAPHRAPPLELGALCERR